MSDMLTQKQDEYKNLRADLDKFEIDRDETILSPEDSRTAQKLIEDLEAKGEEIKALQGKESLRARANDLLEVEDQEKREKFNSRSSRDPFDLMPLDAKRKQALMGWLAHSTADGATELQQRCMAELGFRGQAKSLKLTLPNANSEDQRTMSTTTDGEGGYTVPTLLHDEIVESRDKYNAWFGLGTRINTSTGATYEIPTNDDTGNTGVIYAENAAISNTDPSFAVIQLNGYKYTSDIVKAPWELMRDAAFNLEAFIGGMLGKRIGRKTNTDFTVGDGSAKAHGITATAGDSGVTCASNSAISYAEWVNIKMGLTEPYDMDATWMFNRAVLGFALKTVDSQNRPIFMPSMVPGAPGTILGSPYSTNPNMPTGASAKAVVYGDLSQQYIREVGSIELIRLDELYAASGQVGFVAWQSFDSELIDAGDDPVVYATLAA